MRDRWWAVSFHENGEGGNETNQLELSFLGQTQTVLSRCQLCSTFRTSNNGRKLGLTNSSKFPIWVGLETMHVLAHGLEVGSTRPWSEPEFPTSFPEQIP